MFYREALRQLVLKVEIAQESVDSSNLNSGRPEYLDYSPTSPSFMRCKSTPQVYMRDYIRTFTYTCVLLA